MRYRALHCLPSDVGLRWTSAGYIQVQMWPASHEGPWRRRSSLGTAPIHCLFCTLVYLTAQVPVALGQLGARLGCCQGREWNSTEALRRGRDGPVMGPWQHPSPLFWVHKGLLTICCRPDLLGRGLEAADILRPTHLGTAEHLTARVVSLCPIASQSPPQLGNKHPNCPKPRESQLSPQALLAEHKGPREGLRRRCQ